MKRPLYVAFTVDVAVKGLDAPSISAWDRAKHEKVLKLEEKGSWLVMTQDNGQSIEVPITSVAYIRRDVDDGKDGKK